MDETMGLVVLALTWRLENQPTDPAAAGRYASHR